MHSEKKSLNELSTIIVTIATVLFAVTSMITVYISITSWREARESARPYFTFEKSPSIIVDNELYFEFTFKNVGTHPAINLLSKTFVFDYSLSKDPIHLDQYALVNQIPKNASTSLLLGINKKELNPDNSNIEPHFIVVGLHYDDPIIDKNYNQIIFLRWNGTINGKIQSVFHASVDEKDKILNYFDKFKIDLDY